MLMYRQFNYLRLDKLYNLYKVITLLHLIKVLVKYNIYKVYTIIKMTNLIPKLISKYKAFPLTLI